jgi:hypothetical protein
MKSNGCRDEIELNAKPENRHKETHLSFPFVAVIILFYEIYAKSQGTATINTHFMRRNFVSRCNCVSN